MNNKKKIYFAHPSLSQFNMSFYFPLKNSSLNDVYEIIFPNEGYMSIFKKNISDSFFFIADVSDSNLELGMQIGFASMVGIPIVFTYKKGSDFSSSLKYISEHFIEYENIKDLIDKLEDVIIEEKII